MIMIYDPDENASRGLLSVNWCSALDSVTMNLVSIQSNRWSASECLTSNSWLASINCPQWITKILISSSPIYVLISSITIRINQRYSRMIKTFNVIRKLSWNYDGWDQRKWSRYQSTRVLIDKDQENLTINRWIFMQQFTAMFNRWLFQWSAVELNNKRRAVQVDLKLQCNNCDQVNFYRMLCELYAVSKWRMIVGFIYQWYWRIKAENVEIFSNSCLHFGNWTIDSVIDGIGLKIFSTCNQTHRIFEKI